MEVDFEMAHVRDGKLGADGLDADGWATGHIRRERGDTYHVLRIARADKMNALDRAMYRALTAGLLEGEADDGVAVHVILGQPGVFCAGNDISDFAAAAGNSGATSAEAVKDILDFVRLLPRLRKPLIAGVDGVAVGIGTTLLFHCDMVYATENARFSTPFVDLGLVPEAGSGLLAQQRLGYLTAFELLVAGRQFGAEFMAEAGLVNRLVPAEDLDEVVVAVAKCLGAKPRSAMLASKALMKSDLDAIAAQVEREAEAFARHLVSEEAQTAFATFLARRRTADAG